LKEHRGREVGVEGRQGLVIVLSIGGERGTELFQVALAVRLARILASPGKYGKEDRGQDRDDGDYDEQLNQRETGG